MTDNVAKAGAGRSRAYAHGGGIYIGSAATVCLDAFTLTNTPDDIFGAYTLL